MYVTRRLSEYHKNPSGLRQALPEGPRSGVLVIQDEESQPKCCFGFCYGSNLRGLPFPQNAKLTVVYTHIPPEEGEAIIVYRDPVVFIPVLDQPLSSNLYYVINRLGEHSGEAFASATEDDRVSDCLCCSYIPDHAKLKPPDPSDIYQQFKIHQGEESRRQYYATSVALNGVEPEALKRKGWRVEYSTSGNCGLSDDAKGLDTKLRSELRDLSENVEIGKWYVPFIFVKEGDVKDQVKKWTYYSMTLEQRWEKVFSFENINSKDGKVVVEGDVGTQVAKIEGKEIAHESESADADGVVWFRGTDEKREDKKIGLRTAVVERMRWEEERFGWKSKDENRVRVKRVEKCESGVYWKSYRCYVLVESFVLRRKDGSLVLTYEFRHVDKLRSKWD